MGDQRIYNPTLVDRARKFAEAKHRNQFRKDRKTPFIEHPEAVVELLQQSGFREDSTMLAAGWLHDVIEDTDATYGEIYELFGEEVAMLVDFVTKPKGPFSHKRYVARLKHGPDRAKILKFHDVVANIQDLELCERKFQKFMIGRARDWVEHLFGEGPWHAWRSGMLFSISLVERDLGL